MNILHACPAGLATGGTEGIHHLVSEFNRLGANAKILYVGKDLRDPQPRQYAHYDCPYVTEFRHDFDGMMIFPEVWGNAMIRPEYKNCDVAMNWQGIDVYRWNVPASDVGLFLKRSDAMHITMSEYGMEYLRQLGLNPIKVPDCINSSYLVDFPEEFDRGDVVLYNPTRVKMTRFQEIVMVRCETELGIKFRPLEGYSQDELIDIFRHSKLYIDFGAFSGRERLPREAVSCGCCILTSTMGTAGYFEDNSIPDRYKMTNINEAVRMVKYVLDHFEECRPDFDDYRWRLRMDSMIYPNSVKELYDAILDHHSRS